MLLCARTQTRRKTLMEKASVIGSTRCYGAPCLTGLKRKKVVKWNVEMEWEMVSGRVNGGKIPTSVPDEEGYRRCYSFLFSLDDIDRLHTIHENTEDFPFTYYNVNENASYG
jgi:hypothetical protein